MPVTEPVTGCLGEIRMFGGIFPPVGWALCDGSLLAISQNRQLYNVIGTTYGGDGITTFALPDLRSRVPVHAGSGLALGQAVGEETVTLTDSHIPPHTHTLTCATTGSVASPANNYPGVATDTISGLAIYGNAAPNTSMAPGTILPAGTPPIFTIGGSPLAGDTVTATFTSAALGGNSPHSVTYTLTASDTSTDLVGQHLAAAINADAILKAAGIAATDASSVVTISYPGTSGQLFVSVTSGPGATIAASPPPTATIAFSAPGPQLRVGGTAHTGDEFNVLLTGGGLNNAVLIQSPSTTGYSATGDAQVLRMALNANATLQGAGISSYGDGNVLTLVAPGVTVSAWVNSVAPTLTIGGTPAVNDTVTATFTANGLSTTPHSVVYTLTAGDTSTDLVGQHLAAAINADPILSAAGISAADASSVVTIGYGSPGTIGQLRVSGDITITAVPNTAHDNLQPYAVINFITPLSGGVGQTDAIAFIGEIRIFANYLPDGASYAGWARCDGQIVSTVGVNNLLAQVISNYYGGDGRSTIGLPDLRGRAPMMGGMGRGLLPRGLGGTGGEPTVTLQQTHMPAHTHSLMANTTTATDPTPVNNVYMQGVYGSQGSGGNIHLYTTDAPGTPLNSLALSTVLGGGGGGPHNNMQPFLGLTFLINQTGYFPFHPPSNP